MTETLSHLASTASAVDLASLVKKGKISPVELMKATITNIEQKNASLNAFVHLGYEQALKRAREQESKRAREQESKRSRFSRAKTSGHWPAFR